LYVYITEDNDLGRMWPEYLLALFSPIQGQKKEFAVTILFVFVCVCVCVCVCVYVAVFPILTL